MYVKKLGEHKLFGSKMYIGNNNAFQWCDEFFKIFLFNIFNISHFITLK